MELLVDPRSTLQIAQRRGLSPEAIAAMRDVLSEASLRATAPLPAAPVPLAAAPAPPSWPGARRLRCLRTPARPSVCSGHRSRHQRSRA